MKLNEINPAQENEFLTGASAIKWMRKYLKGDRGSNNVLNENADGTWNINGDTVLTAPEFRVKVSKIRGDLRCSNLSIKSLKNFPDEVTGLVDVSTTGIKSFNGMPKCKAINAFNCGRLKNILLIFSYIQSDLLYLDIEGCNVSNFSGIADVSKHVIKDFWFDSGEEDFIGGLGVMLMKGLQSFCKPENVKRMAEPWQIIYNHFDSSGADGIFQAQSQLIDGGWDRMAEL